MLSLKGLLVISALAVLATPAFAVNGDTRGNGPGMAQAAPSTEDQMRGCSKTDRPLLTPEQRAQRRAMRQQRQAERAAQGLPPRKTGQHKPRC